MLFIPLNMFRSTQIILHVFALLGHSCGWTVNDNSHVVRIFLLDDLVQVLHEDNETYSIQYLLLFDC